MTTCTGWDAIVLGGGAAGLTAGVVLARTGIDVIVVEDRTPRNAPATEMHGFPGRDGAAPAGFLEETRREVVHFGGRILAARAAEARAVGVEGEDGFEVVLNDGSVLRAPAVLVATGLRDELPEVPGMAKLWGSTVHHCPHCHGAEVREQRIAVVGGLTPSMTWHQAALLRRYGRDVILIPNGLEAPDEVRRRLDAIGVEIVEGAIAELEQTEGVLRAVRMADGRRIERDVVFTAPRMVSRDALLATLGVPGAGSGVPVAVSPTGRTARDGVWAAGNVVNPRAQVVTAAGEGSAAAIDITSFLVERDLARAVAGLSSRLAR